MSKLALLLLRDPDGQGGQDDERLTGIAARLAATDKVPGLMYVFRRHGYSEAENPEHLTSVMSSEGMPVILGATSARLDPTLAETVLLLARAVFESGSRENAMMLAMMGGGVNRHNGKAPASVAVDCEAVVEPLRALLDRHGCGIDVDFYPPPSREEARMYSSMGPGF